MTGDIPTMDIKEISAPWSKVTVGSNVFLNNDGVAAVLVVDGEAQIAVERGTNDNQLLLSIDLFDATGCLMGKLRRNAWPAAHNNERFVVSTNPSSLTFTDTHTGDVVVAASVYGADELEISHGHFHTRNGEVITIEPDCWIVGGITMRRNMFEDCSIGIDLSSGAFPSG